MYAARVRASLKPLFSGRVSSNLSRSCEIAETSRRILQDRFINRASALSNLPLSGNGVRIKLLHRAFHSSPQCYRRKSDVASAMLRFLEDSKFGSVDENGNRDMTEKLVTEKSEPFQELPQKSRSKKKKHGQASIYKLKLLTEKPNISWKISGKKKGEANASSPESSITDSDDSFSNSTKAQNITIPKDCSISNTPSSCPSSVLVIRIRNLNSKTADSMIHSMCLSIGPLEGLVRVNEEVVDVLYRVRDLSEADSILEELNDASVDYSQWKAEIVPKAEEACRDQIGMRMIDCCEDLEKQLTMLRDLTEDLGILIHSVTHLEENQSNGY